MDFKIGDLVERQRGSHHGMIHGMKDVITHIQNISGALSLENYGNGHTSYKFKLVTPKFTNWKEEMKK